MTADELARARIVWSYLLEVVDGGGIDWRAWAEKEILKVDFVAPFWLGELTVAHTARLALDCVRDGIGEEYGALTGDEIDECSLFFGLLYLKFSRQHERAKETWLRMADFGDIHEYVDAGHWRKYQRNCKIDLSGLSVEDSVAIIFRPVAGYALRTIRAILRSSPQRKRAHSSNQILTVVGAKAISER